MKKICSLMLTVFMIMGSSMLTQAANFNACENFERPLSTSFNEYNLVSEGSTIGTVALEPSGDLSRRGNKALKMTRPVNPSNPSGSSIIRYKLPTKISGNYVIAWDAFVPASADGSDDAGRIVGIGDGTNNIYFKMENSKLTTTDEAYSQSAFETALNTGYTHGAWHSYKILMNTRLQQALVFMDGDVLYLKDNTSSCVVPFSFNNMSELFFGINPVNNINNEITTYLDNIDVYNYKFNGTDCYTSGVSFMWYGLDPEGIRADNYIVDNPDSSIGGKCFKLERCTCSDPGVAGVGTFMDINFPQTYNKPVILSADVWAGPSTNIQFGFGNGTQPYTFFFNKGKAGSTMVTTNIGDVAIGPFIPEFSKWTNIKIYVEPRCLTNYYNGYFMVYINGELQYTADGKIRFPFISHDLAQSGVSNMRITTTWDLGDQLNQEPLALTYFNNLTCYEAEQQNINEDFYNIPNGTVPSEVGFDIANIADETQKSNIKVVNDGNGECYLKLANGSAAASDTLGSVIRSFDSMQGKVSIEAEVRSTKGKFKRIMLRDGTGNVQIPVTIANNMYSVNWGADVQIVDSNNNEATLWDGNWHTLRFDVDCSTDSNTVVTVTLYYDGVKQTPMTYSANVVTSISGIEFGVMGTPDTLDANSNYLDIGGFKVYSTDSGTPSNVVGVLNTPAPGGLYQDITLCADNGESILYKMGTLDELKVAKVAMDDNWYNGAIRAPASAKYIAAVAYNKETGNWGLMKIIGPFGGSDQKLSVGNVAFESGAANGTPVSIDQLSDVLEGERLSADITMVRKQFGDENCTAILALFDSGGKLAAVTSQEFNGLEFYENAETVTLDTTGIDLKNMTAHVYIWSNFTEISPISTEYYLDY